MKAPSLVEIDAQARTLILHWGSDAVQRVDQYALRQACPCAQCRRLRIGGGIPECAHDVAVTDIRPMGYGIQLVFSDGHDRGIFPWPYLESLPDRTTVAAQRFG